LSRGYVEAVEHVGNGNHEYERRQSQFVILSSGPVPDLVGNRVRAIAETGYRLRQCECCPLRMGEVRRFATSRARSEVTELMTAVGLRAGEGG